LQQQGPPAEQHIDLVVNASVEYYPTDLAISPDGTKVVVRTTEGVAPAGQAYDGRTYVFSLSPPYSFSSVYTEGGFFGSSNWLATLDDRCLSVATQATGSQHAQILDISNPSAISQLALYGPADTWDVEVGYHQGVPFGMTQTFFGVELYDLSGGTSAGALAIPFLNDQSGSYFSGWGKDLSDSIKATSSRVLAISNRSSDTTQTTPRDGYVGIGEITGFGPGWTKTFGFSCTPPGYSGSCSQASPTEFLHDLTINTSGGFGVVSGQGVIGVYGLRLGVELKKYIDSSGNTLPIPHMQRLPWNRATADSVEASNTKAVVIGNDSRAEVQTSPLHWRVTVLTLSSDPAQVVATHFADEEKTVDSTVHDVAISPNGARAVVTTRKKTLVFNLASPMPGYAEVDTGADPLSFVSLPGSPLTIVANSVDVNDEYAVVIGRNVSGDGILAVIDFVADGATNQVTTFVIHDPASPSLQYLPTDVQINDSGSRVVVRSSLVPPTPASTDGRLDVYSLETLSWIPFDLPVGVVPDVGRANAPEQLDASYTMAVSAGNGPAPGGGNPPTGLVQVLRIDD
jgi:hypothetical protein